MLFKKQEMSQSTDNIKIIAKNNIENLSPFLFNMPNIEFYEKKY